MSARDSKYNAVTVDEMTGKVNDGNAFVYSSFCTAITSAGYWYWPVKTRVALMNAFVKFSTTHAGRLTIYRKSSFTISTGNIVTGINRNESSSNACSTQFVDGSSAKNYKLISTGTAMYTRNVNVGDYDLGKYVFTKNSDYLVEFLNSVGDTASASLMIDFYEV